MALVNSSKPEAFLNSCLQCLENVDDHQLAPSKINPNNNFLTKIRSNENMRHWDVEGANCTFPGKGKPGSASFPTIYIEYEVGVCDDDCDTEFDLCTMTGPVGATEDTMRYKTLELNKRCGKTKRVTAEEMQSFCEEPGERLQRFLVRMAEQALRNINKDSLDEYIGGVDSYPNGDNPLTNTASVTVINSEGNIVPAGFAAIDAAYRKNMFDGNKCIVGGTTLASYFDVRGYQGAGQNGTGTVDPFSNYNFSYDSVLDSRAQAITTDTTASYGVVFPEGAFGIYLDYNKHQGAYETSSHSLLRTTINILGIEWDYFVHYDEKCNEWVFGISKDYCHLCWEEDDYCESTGFKWLFKFICGDFECDALNIC